MNRTARDARRALIAPAAKPEVTAAATVPTDVLPPAEEKVPDHAAEASNATAKPGESQVEAPATDALAELVAETDPAAANCDADRSANDGSKRWLKMKIGISGTEYSLSPGWKYAFCDQPGPDGEPSEAQRLVDAKYAIDTDPPTDD